MNGYIIIDQSSTAAHTANWCARFSHMFHHQSWPQQSNPNTQQTLTSCWFIATTFDLPICNTFSIAFFFKKSLNHKMSLPQLWIPRLVIISTTHSFEERLSGDWNFCHQPFSMYPCITMISTTKHAANQCLRFALCSTKQFPVLQFMITVRCGKNT